MSTASVNNPAIDFIAAKLSAIVSFAASGQIMSFYSMTYGLFMG